MSGWKTWLGMSLIAVGTAMQAFETVIPELVAIGDLLIGFGVALGGVGVAHKIEKAAPKE